MMMKILFPSLLIIVFLFSCKKTETPQPPSTSSSPNILLIIADDMGIDASPCYSIGAEKPNMPNLEALCSNGLTFDNLWSAPVCSPTRATIMTGKYGVRTNVIDAGDLLSTTETTLQKFIGNNASENYNQAVIGKWHLSGTGRNSHPNDFGLSYYAGIIGGAVGDYFDWELDINGTPSIETTYSTTKITDLAIDWIGAQNDNPWFAWVAYNAAHTPLHLPPNDLHTKTTLDDDPASVSANPMAYYMAMLEAMDTEMGRLIDAIPTEEKDNTVIIFIGDNGTIIQAVQAPYTKKQRKATLSQGGINVPMIISGIGVDRKGDRENALINTTDLFTTIADIAGSSTTEIHDSKSFKSLLTDGNGEKREYVYVDWLSDDLDPEWAIRNETYKLIERSDGTQELYNLIDDPYEGVDLMNGSLSSAEETARATLSQKALEIRQ